MSQKILISTSSFGGTSPEPLRRLERAGVGYRLNPHGRRLSAEELVALLEDRSGLIAGTEPIDAGVLARLPALRVISRCGAGLDNVDLRAAEERGIVVFNTPDAPIHAVAELALAGALDLLRSIAQTDRALRAGEWRRPMGHLLRGRTVGIVGFGRIGRAFARLLEPFAVTLLAHDPAPDEDAARRLGVRYCPLDELLAASDIVSLHLTGGPETRRLIDAEALSRCKRGALLVNCSRGQVVDEDALYEAVLDGRLAGAFLDVFEREPYLGRLTELPNVLLTPHIGSYAAESRESMELEAVDHLLAFYGLGGGE